MGWADPNWNWGSAIGEAHNEAMKVRGALSSEAARKSFLFMVFAGQAPFDTVKMLGKFCKLHFAVMIFSQNFSNVYEKYQNLLDNSQNSSDFATNILNFRK